MDVNNTLKERGSNYGKYIDQTKICKEFRDIIDKHKPVLACDQEDALYMIVMKISRILNGKPDYTDNWLDIAGYATLVAKRLEGTCE